METYTQFPGSGSIPGDCLAFSVEEDPNEWDNICVGGQQMLYYSNDRGDTFHERVNGTNPLVVTAIDVDFPNLCIQSPGFIFKSSDWGENLASRICTTYTSSGGIQRDWGEDNLWFAGVNDGSTNGTLYISEDNGETWEDSPGITSPIFCLMPDSTFESDYLFAAGLSSFHISSNNGNNWVLHCFNSSKNVGNGDLPKQRTCKNSSWSHIDGYRK